MRTSDDTTRKILRRSDNLDQSVFAVGIEILPYDLVGVIADSDGTLRDSCWWSLGHMEPAHVVEQIAAIARYLVRDSLGIELPNSRVCVGLQIGGPVDAATGTVILYKNPREEQTKPPYTWENEPLIENVERMLGCATVLENDANAYAAYEQKLGVGQEIDSFGLILMRDGVGASVIINRRPLPVPLEIGHIPIWPNGRTCDCGNLGCTESQTGCRAIRAMVGEVTGLGCIDPFERAIAIADGDGKPATLALEVFHQAGDSIARVIATIFTLFGPSHLVLYGPELLVAPAEASKAADTFMAAVNMFPGYTFRGVGKCELETRVLHSTYLDRVGAHGAALAALNRHFAIPLGSHLEQHP